MGLGADRGWLPSSRPPDRSACQGARAVLRVVSGEGRDIPLAVMMVWVDMLRADAKADIGAVAAGMDDPRVRSFHDPVGRASKAIAAALGAEGQRAWDVYLFYGPEAEWKERPPAPRGWVHQLSDGWADPDRHRHGDRLEPELAALLLDVASHWLAA
jgi:hypothetical protein